MGLVLQLVETGADRSETRGRGIDVLELDRPRNLRDIANLGLTLPEAKQLLARVQKAVVAVQARDHAALRPACSGCGARCHVKDWQSRQVQLRHAAVGTPEPAPVSATPASAITLSLDSTFIRSCHKGERHLEVRVGNAEAVEGDRQVFGTVANAGTDIAALIGRTLDVLGQTSNTVLTAFTDGCSGLRAILAAAGIAGPPIADWFHLAMRLQHAKQVAEALPAEDPHQQQAKAEIVTEVERLRWRTWNGKAKAARITLKRLRTLLPALEREPIRKLKRALRAVDRYLRSQSTWLVNYAERWRAGLRVGTSLTEGTANFLVNKRMDKSQQMRWSRRGADLLLQVRCAVYNGALGFAFGQLFEPIPTSDSQSAKAA